MLDLNEYPLNVFWKRIQKRKWWIAAFVAVCVTSAAAYIYITQPIYRISQKVVINEDPQRSMTLDILQAVHSTGLLPNEQLNNKIEEITSIEMMEKVVARLNLETACYSKKGLRTRDLYNDSPIKVIPEENCTPFFSFVLTKTSDGLLRISDFSAQGTSYPDFSPTPSVYDTLSTPAGKLLLLPTDNFGNWEGKLWVNRIPAYLRAQSFNKNLSTKIISPKNSVFTLTLEDVSSERAKTLLSTLISIYEEETAAIRKKANRAVLDFLAARTAVLEKELGDIEDRIKDFKQKHHITDIGQAGNALYSMSATYGNKAFDVSNQLAIAKMIRDFIADPAHVNDLLPANSGLANSALIARIDEYNRTMLERDRAYVVSSEENPHVKEKTNALDRLRISIIRSIDSLIGSLNLELDRQLNRERELLGKVAKNSEEALDLLSLERQRKIKEQLYLFLLQKQEENELKSLLEVGSDVHSMPPSGGAAPVAPRKALILLMALLFGLSFPVLLIYFLTLYDGSVRKASDMKDSDIPFLGSIPLVKKLRGRNTSGLATVVSRDGKDEVNDAFRIIRTRLDALVTEASPVILVTAPDEDYGKSFTTLNLAAAMALKGLRVLVADADLRNSALTRFLGKEREAGIAEYLGGKNEDTRSLIVPLNESTDFLPAGQGRGNPAELLISKRTADLLGELRRHYDCILLDTSAMESVADSSILAAYTDFSIIVIRAGKYERRLLPELEQRCKGEGHQRLATLLNGVE